jgi:hypothetical protein
MKATYSNPVFLEQMKKQNKEPDMSGFVEQHPLDLKQEPANDSTEQINDGSADIFDDEDEDSNDDGLAEEIIEVVEEPDEAPQVEFKFGRRKVSTNQSVREKLSEVNIEVAPEENEKENRPQRLKLNTQKQTIKLKRG